MAETALQTRVLKELNRLGIWAFRVNSGGKRGRIRLAPAGTPDICLPALGWLELKVGNGELSPEQAEWHERAKREGVWVATAWTLEEAIRLVRERQRELRMEQALEMERAYPP